MSDREELAIKVVYKVVFPKTSKRYAGMLATFKDVFNRHLAAYGARDYTYYRTCNTFEAQEFTLTVQGFLVKDNLVVGILYNKKTINYSTNIPITWLRTQAGKKVKFPKMFHLNTAITTKEVTDVPKDNKQTA